MYRLLLFIFLFFPILVSSQNNYQVKYNMTTLFDGLKNYEAKLSFSDSQSYFEYILAVKDTATIESQDSNGNIKISIPEKKAQKIYFDFKTKKYYEIKYIKEEFVVQDTINLPNWNIFEEIKNINNHQCRKATSTFKGRNYEVWFTDEYPTMCGPWKLNGLPGLIILAQDQKREVFFEAIEIFKTPDVIEEPTISNKIISPDEFQLEVQKMQKNIEERLKSMGDRNSKVSVKFGKAVGIEILD
jgi:GLPGLI family protein